MNRTYLAVGTVVSMMAVATAACNAPEPDVVRLIELEPQGAADGGNVGFVTPTLQPTAPIDGTAALGATALPTPTVTATPELYFVEGNPLSDYSIPTLLNHQYDGGEFILEQQVFATDQYTQYAFSHLSDDFEGNRVRVTGLVNIPNGAGPYPATIILHGGVDQSAYEQGDDSAQYADVLANNGYVAFMPDYQSYNDTDGSGSPLKIPWAIDVMNLISVLDQVQKVDPTRIGVLGHSRGGGIASYIMVLSREVDAVVLYAPLHVDQDVVWTQYDEVFGSEWPFFDAQVWGSPESNPEGYRMVSPGNYLELVEMPVQIHHGDQDFTTPLFWSQELFERMTALDKDVELFVYEGGLHTFTGGTYTQFMNRVVAFFDEEVKAAGN